MSRIGKIWSFLTKPEVYWRLFSLALAVIFWLLATGGGTLAETERTVTLEVQVQNIPDQLVLVDPPERVRVRIRGLAPLINRGEGSLSAFIDLSGAEEGTETYSVQVDEPLGINIVSVTPQWVSVYTEDLAESVFPVTLVFLGIDRSRASANIRPSPAVITIRGAGSILEEVDHVVAYIGTDRMLNEEMSFPVQALDAQGRSVEGLEIDPPEIRVIEVVDEGEE